MIRYDTIFLDQVRILLNDFSFIYTNAKVCHLTDSELVNYYNEKNIQGFEHFRDLVNEISTNRYTNHKAEIKREKIISNFEKIISSQQLLKDEES